MLDPLKPALILAPMEGITDAPMRALQCELAPFTFCVSEFLRVSTDPLPGRVVRRDVPELLTDSKTPTGTPVMVQLLGGDPERMAQSAWNAIQAGAVGVDINFGCPAKTVNRNDGGATLLKFPSRIREIVRAVREAVPSDYPVSAKLRLGWDSIDSIHENSAMACEGGASWITIHARTRMQGYMPPVYWNEIGTVQKSLGLPIVANGDIWTIQDFRACQEATNCIHFMIGRGALANPLLADQIADELGIGKGENSTSEWKEENWVPRLKGLLLWTYHYQNQVPVRTVLRLKQWLKIAENFGDFTYFERIKRTENVEDMFEILEIAFASNSVEVH